MGVKEDIMLEEKFKFDLQLFADESADNTVEQPKTDSAEPQELPDFALDADGNVTFNPAIFDDVQEDEQEESQPQPEPQTEPDTYIVKVDGVEQEVTLDELLHGYMRQADYSRKTQALAEERRNLQSTPQQPQYQPQQPQPQPEPQQPEFNQKAYVEKLAEYAKGQVEQILGEEYDQYNTLHQAAYADAIANIKAEIIQQQQAQAAQQAAEQQFVQNLTKYTSDPNFAQIDNLAATKLNELPYAQAVKIKEAFDNRDWNIIDQYMTAVRNEFYGQASVPSIRPKPKAQVPYVESAGAATRPPEMKRQIDFSKIGDKKLNNDQLADMFVKLGLTNL